MATSDSVTEIFCLPLPPSSELVQGVPEWASGSRLFCSVFFKDFYSVQTPPYYDSGYNFCLPSTSLSFFLSPFPILHRCHSKSGICPAHKTGVPALGIFSSVRIPFFPLTGFYPPSLFLPSMFVYTDPLWKLGCLTWPHLPFQNTFSLDFWRFSPDSFYVISLQEGSFFPRFPSICPGLAPPFL